MNQNLSRRLDKIEQQIKPTGNELIVAWTRQELKEAHEKVRKFEEENPGVPAPYLIIRILFVEAKNGKPTGREYMIGD